MNEEQEAKAHPDGTSLDGIREFGTGCRPDNPPRCFVCRKRLRRNDHWIRYTSPDPSPDGYALVVHADCVWTWRAVGAEKER